MATHACETCRMRTYYEDNPRSLRGRLWLWHTKWCPGWKAYVKSRQQAIAEQEAGEPKAS